MSDKDNNTHASELERERAQQAKEAKKKLKDAEKSKGGKQQPKEQKPKKNTGKKVVRFFKDFRGEIKKIIWPDFKTVMKNTGIVLVTVLIIGILVWVLDFGLTTGIKGLKYVAQNTQAVTTTAVATTAPGAAEPTTGSDASVQIETDLLLPDLTEAVTEPQP